MRVFINRRVVNGPYGGGNLFVKAFFDFARDFGVEPTNVLDANVRAVLMVDPRPDDLGVSLYEIMRFVKANPTVKVVQRVNECDARKGTNEIDRLLAFSSIHVDRTVFVSKWMELYHRDRGWCCPTTGVILNGVDKAHFRRVESQSDKVRVVAHHWSDNVKKGSDVYRWLDEFVAANSGYTFTYIGRTKDVLPNTSVVSPLFGQALGDRLAPHDVYVSGSRFDPGPNHVIEAIACELPTYVHVDGGGAVEFAGPDHVFGTLDELRTLLLSRKFERNTQQFYDWHQCIQQYVDVIRKTVQ